MYTRVIPSFLMTSLLCALISFAPGIQAQEKNMYVDLKRVAATCEIGKYYTMRLNQERRRLNDQIMKQYDKVMEMQRDMHDRSPAMSDEKIREKQAEFEKMTNEIHKERENANRQMSRKTKEAMGVLTKMMREVVVQVARQEGATMVFDSSTVLYADPKVDITEKVIEAMNKLHSAP